MEEIEKEMDLERERRSKDIDMRREGAEMEGKVMGRKATDQRLVDTMKLNWNK